MTARKKIGETSSSLTNAIAIVATALVIVVGVAVGLLLSKTNDNVDPQMPSSDAATASASASTKPSNSKTSKPSSKPSSETKASSSTTQSSTASTRTSTSSSTLTSPKTSGTSATQTTVSQPSRTSEPTSTTTTPAPAGQDFGTGRSDVDGLGFTNSAARCHSGDRAFAIVATDQGSKAAACETRSGRKYYRGETADGNSLETDIIVDEGNRIVAQNGSWKYQMSPDGLLITENNVVKNRQAAVAWGTA